MYEGTYNFDKKILIPLCEKLANDTPGFDTILQESLEIGAAGSTAAGIHSSKANELFYQQPHKWPELKDFTNWIIAHATQILKSWEFQFDNVVIVSSWTNRHRKGGFTNWHQHYHTDLNVAAYLQAPPDSGNLLITDPLEMHWAGYPVYRNHDFRGGYVLTAEDNKVYFFPGFLRHSTEASKSDEDRWVITYNIKTTRKDPLK
jgi:uncharacterized protein (TIGR02466 family)